MSNDMDHKYTNGVAANTPSNGEKSFCSPSWLGDGDAHGQDGSPTIEPIAIIGMSCRMPGGVNDPSSLWKMLVSGRTAWTPGPGERFNLQAFQDSSGRKADTTNACGGHFLTDDVAGFDAAFFGINPIEAKAMDPQNRLLLEVAYETFQNSGLSTDFLWGSNTGVFIGQCSSDYHEIETRDIQAPPIYLLIGTGVAVSSNRISYNFNLLGPSMTIDTGCSSSLVALHQAVGSLRSGETSMCFVGGTNLLLDPQRFVYQSKMNMFSAEGRSFSFDSRANGYGRGEGLAGMMLKPLSAALRDGDHVRAVIRNSVSNQDGKTTGLTVPSADAQERAILKAYGEANLELYADYVEAHGTGTKVGDPVEASAIAAALQKNRKSSLPLPIGSVKASVGHTEGTSGLAGMIKAVLMLEQGIIPPQATYKQANPDLRLSEWNLCIPTQAVKRNLRRISVNSFGYGGTNAHVVVDAAPHHAASSSSPTLVDGLSNSVPRLFFISAATEKSCQRICSRLAKYLVLEHRGSCSAKTVLARLAYSLGKETFHAHRLAVVASGLDDLLDQLSHSATAAIPHRDKRREPRIALVFSGQGAQYAEMGRELLDNHSTFTSSIKHARQQLTELGCEWDLLEELCRPKDQSRINDPAISQPASTAIQLALVDVLGELDILPSAVLGHSSGEIAAAYAAGSILFEDAISISYYRGKLVGDMVLTNRGVSGAMLAVGADPATVNHHIEAIETAHGLMRIACFNSPSSVTVSGDASAVEELRLVLDTHGVFNRKLSTNGAAYHSHQMGIMEKKYAAALKRSLKATKKPTRSTVRLFSSVTGKETSTTPDSSYWVENLLSPVLFTQALQEMCQAKYLDDHIDLIVEVGPHAQLRGPVQQTIKAIQPESAQKTTYLGTLNRGNCAEISLLECLGTLKVRGAPISLDRINGFSKDRRPLRLVDLPPYPFDHEQIFWHETRISRNYRHRKHLPHELLGSLVPDTSRVEPTWRHLLSLKESPWLCNHLIQGHIVFPAAGFITMALQATKQHAQITNPTSRVESLLFRNISISKALVLSRDGPDVEIVLSLRPEARTATESSKVWSEFRIFTVASENVWSEHCRGLVQATDTEDEAPNVESFDRIGASCTHELSPRKLYHLGCEIGIDWQHPFDNILSAHTGNNACIATARQSITDTAPGGLGDIIHPSVLDSCLFQGLCAVEIIERGANSTFVPFFIEQLCIYNRPTQPSNKLVSTSTLCEDSSGFDVVVQNSDSNQDVILLAQGVRTKVLPGDTGLNQVIKNICHSQAWATYVDSWTPAHRDQVCKVNVPPGSAAEVNLFLDALSIYYVQKAVEKVTAADVPDGHRRHFFEWMKIAAGRSSQLAVPPVSEDFLEESLVQGVLRVGPELHKILTNEVDPLTLLTPDNLLARLYDSKRAARCTSQIAEYCCELGNQTRGLKVLEVGAGTASATLPVLEALNGRGSRSASRYDFTDISPGFFGPAKDRLGDLADVVEFKILDIERSPEEQGFEAASYDLIIASNVIHATSSLATALSNIMTLLKPGGKFILMEITQPTPHYNLLFGVFEGWWAGHAEGRRLSPLLVKSDWISQLELSGFVDAQLWFQDYSEQDGGTLSVFGTTAQVTKNGLPPMHVVTTNLDKYEALFDHGRIGSPQHATELRLSAHSLSFASPGDNIAIVLPDVAALLCAEPDADSWQSFKHWILRARMVLLVSCISNDDSDGLAGGIWLGFARCVREECPSIRIITLELSVQDDMMVERLLEVLPPILDTISAVKSEAQHAQEDEFFEKDGQLFVSRLGLNQQASHYIHRSRQRAEPQMAPFMQKDRPLVAKLGTPGLMETLCWADPIQASTLGPDDIRLELKAASINFKDVLIAAGQLEGLTEMRNDCSGLVIEVGSNMRDRFKPGNRVCALYSRSYTNYPIIHGDCCQTVPNSMCWEEAAALPVVWTTVYYSLIDVGRLSKGDSILIHSAAGAVGQAAIMLAQYLGATVFVTVSSDGKRDLLHERYGIPREHMFSSRTSAFLGGVKALTNGSGVDVVLNSLGGEMFRHSCNLVAPFGRFVEIGRKDLMDDASMPLGFLLKNITFSYVDMALIMEKRRPLARRLLHDVTNLVAAGAIKSVTISTFPISEIETAFRQIQAGKHTGKLVLRVEADQRVEITPQVPSQAELRHNATYTVVGGLGGLGRAVVKWMAEHGAKHILSLSRSGTQSGESRVFLNEMKTMGVKLMAYKCDVSSQDEVSNLAEAVSCAGFPPIRGVIQCAMVAKDSTFEDMAVDEWRGSLGPKAEGTLNLHRSFTDVDFFVVMSSAVALRGSAGLSNYAAGCSFQNALVQHRTALGMPSFSINAGSVLEVGFVSENPVAAAALRRHGFGAISILDVLAMLNYAITRPSCGNPAESVCSIGMLPNNASDYPLSHRRFAHLVQRDFGGRATKNSGDELASLHGASPSDATGIIRRAILQQLSKLIATAVELLDSAKSLDSYGVDSLVAVELRNWIGLHLQANLQLMAVRGANSIDELADVVTGESRLVNADT